MLPILALFCAPLSQVYDFNVPTFGRGVVYDVDQRVRSEQFRWVANALQTTKLRSYVPAFKLVRPAGSSASVVRICRLIKQQCRHMQLWPRALA